MSGIIEFILGTDNSRLKTGLDQAHHQVESFKEQAHETLMGIFAGVGVEQLISKFARVKEVAEMFDTTSEAVQRVDQLAQQFGTNIDTVARAMAKIRGGKGDAFEKLGIDAEHFSHAQLDEQLVMIAEALEKIDDPQQRINKAFEILGPRMKELLPLLNQGSEKIREMMGGFSVASDETVNQLHAAEQAITGMKNTVTVFAADIFGIINKFMLSIGNGVGQSIALISNGLGRVGQAIQALMQGDFKGVGTAMKANLEDIRGGMQSSVESLKNIWMGDKAPEHGAGHHGTWDPSLEQKGGAEKERLSAAERIKALEEEHALKQLDAQERLNRLAQEKLAIEKQLSELANGDDAKRKQLEDRLVANARDRLSAEDELKRDQDRAAQDQLDEINRQAAEYDKQLKKKAKEEEKAREEQSKEEEKAAKKREKDEDRRTMERYRDQERDLGFVSGIKQVGESGQHLAGVDYSVINSEAERGIKLQEEMRNYMKIIAEKEYTVEIPDAS